MELFFRTELQSRRVHTKTRSRGRRTVIKDMAQMPSAHSTKDLGAHHTVRAVLPEDHITLINGPREAGPARAGMKLVIGPKQVSAAGRAPIYSPFVHCIILAGKGAFRTAAPQNVKLRRGKQGLPLRVGLLYLLHGLHGPCFRIIHRHGFTCGINVPGLLFHITPRMANGQ